ncbi:MAG: PAC2 family protein [Candidatus Woesearchaeota archaeon]|jgi:hypothetical protein|nr:PAC2 family protein [Candidatus Woesearchaeota archaeon]MDP7506651.1 PAC2 family protein [Candidatus Woesearchaeota archaeon]MDP7610169.1 PAC2 family protein [Candidatus Woesearchaeota archaeon]|tara:strand:- start:10026 stop:10823 length:798 start_codon:yes stop_codon:yes gene_type:complete
MTSWKVNQLEKQPVLRNPIFIEGLPGIGNVGKVAVDFIIEKLEAKELYEFFSYTMPHSVFVNEENLVELPSIKVYYVKLAKNDLLLLTGDVQPTDEVSSYDFSEKILDIVETFKCKEIVTLGGIGLGEIPKKPKVYATANNSNIVKRYKKLGSFNENLYGVVGPIVGVTGLLLGLADKRKIGAISFLAETYGHPMYLGVKGAREILKILEKRFELGINMNEIDKEIDQLESDLLKRTKDISDVSKQTAIKKLKGKLGGEGIDYIG